MTDTIIKGTGNSRTLGSVPNFLTLYPTYEAFAQAVIDRTLPIDLGPINPAGVETEGTPLNKGTLLSDETSQLLGGVQTVDEALSAIPFKSLAGALWLSRPVSSASDGYMSIACGNGIAAALRCRNESAVANQVTNQLYITEDGVNWKSISLPYTTIWQDIAYGDGVFVAVGYGDSSNYNIGDYAAYSPNGGISWYGVKLPSKDAWKRVGYGNGIFVAMAVYTVTGSTNRLTIAYSTDMGKSWAAADPSAFYNITAIAYGNGRFIAIGQGNIALYSTDGKNWHTMQMPIAAAWKDIAFINGRFIAVASDSATSTDSKGHIYYSDNGLSWHEPEYVPLENSWHYIAYGGGRIVVMTSYNGNMAVYSDDMGLTWKTALPFPRAEQWSGLVFNQGRFIAVDRTHTTPMLSGLTIRQANAPAITSGEAVVMEEAYTDIQLLGQQITDLELMILGGVDNV